MIVKLRRLHPLPTPTPWLYQVSGLFIVKPSIEVHNRKWWDGATSSVVGFQRPLNFFYKAVSGQGLRVHQQRCGGCTVFTPLQRESFIQSRVRFCVCRRFPARTWIYVRAGYPPPHPPLSPHHHLGMCQTTGSEVVLKRYHYQWWEHSSVHSTAEASLNRRSILSNVKGGGFKLHHFERQICVWLKCKGHRFYDLTKTQLIKQWWRINIYIFHRTLATKRMRTDTVKRKVALSELYGTTHIYIYIQANCFKCSSTSSTLQLNINLLNTLTMKL